MSVAWPRLRMPDAMTWRSPTSGAPLHHDTSHSLAGDGRRWPVIDGVPFLRVGREALAADAVAALDAGDRTAALSLLLADQDDWARTPPPEPEALGELIANAHRLSFRAAMDLLALGGVATYFAHRWSDPTFMAGLALVEAHRGAAATAFEIACGAGHHLRALQQAGVTASGGDVVFAKLWLARHWVAPSAGLVCFDASWPWPAADASADLVTCHDALYFLPEKPFVAAEMMRVAGSRGTVLVSHAHNRLVDNLSAGEPCSPSEYATLFGSPRLYDDRELTRALVEARPPRPADPSVLDDAAAVALAVGAQPTAAVTGGVAVPQPGARLMRNPLYDDDGRIVWPSPRYAEEYGPLATYPMTTDLPTTAVMSDDRSVVASARRRALLDLPLRW